MAAALTANPPAPSVGVAVTLSGTDFVPNTLVTVSVPEDNFESEITSDASGAFSTDDLADKAVATLTATGLPTAAQNIVLGGVTYTFRASVSTTANEILIGADAADQLINIKAAVNADTTKATKFGSLTVANPTVGAGALTATTLQFYAKTGGTAGNTIVATTTGSNLALTGSGTFEDTGAAATGISPVIWHPTHEGTKTVTAKDGTNTVTTTVRVWTN